MMNTTTLHIPIDKTVRDRLERKAKGLGFDSAQAYIRVWAKAQVDNRTLDFGDDEWDQPSAAATKRISKAAADAKQGINVSKPFTTIENMMDHLDSL